LPATFTGPGTFTGDCPVCVSPPEPSVRHIRIAVHVLAGRADCVAAAQACSSMCGTSARWELSYSFWHPSWGMIDVYNYTFGSGVASFECDSVADYSHCSCVYLTYVTAAASRVCL